MSDYYNRQGEPITMGEWASLLEAGRDEGKQTYSCVVSTQLRNVVVSTVWLGLNHSFGSGRPLIFETMVFRTRRIGKKREVVDWAELASNRYSTESEARAGHQEMVRAWKGKRNETLKSKKAKQSDSAKTPGVQERRQKTDLPLEVESYVRSRRTSLA